MVTTVQIRLGEKHLIVFYIDLKKHKYLGAGYTGVNLRKDRKKVFIQLSIAVYFILES